MAWDPQHLPLVRGGSADYSVMLGQPPTPARHTIGSSDIDPATDGLPRLQRTARRDHSTRSVTPLFPDARRLSAVSLAPIVYARPNTVGRFTDVPLVMWYEVEPTERGTRYRYSVIFSNEDGGTSTDRLMATWGRTTDIEYLYSVEVDADGAIVGEDMQGPEHEILPFKGKREGRHPLLWVSTENNMVLDHGDDIGSLCAGSLAVDLDEGLARGGDGRQPVALRGDGAGAAARRQDRRRCADRPGHDSRSAAVCVCRSLRRRRRQRHRLAVDVCRDADWLPSDRGMHEYRIVRDGCFRAAIPLPGRRAR